MVHQVGDAGDRPRRDRQRLEQLGRRLRRRRHRDRAGVVDVVDEPHGDASILGAEERSLDDLRRLVVQPDVVERELEALLRGVEELGHLVRDVDGGLAAVAVEPKLDHPAAVKRRRDHEEGEGRGHDAGDREDRCDRAESRKLPFESRPPQHDRAGQAAGRAEAEQDADPELVGPAAPLVERRRAADQPEVPLAAAVDQPEEDGGRGRQQEAETEEGRGHEVEQDGRSARAPPFERRRRGSDHELAARSEAL